MTDFNEQIMKVAKQAQLKEEKIINDCLKREGLVIIRDPTGNVLNNAEVKRDVAMRMTPTGVRSLYYRGKMLAQFFPPIKQGGRMRFRYKVYNNNTTKIMEYEIPSQIAIISSHKDKWNVKLYGYKEGKYVPNTTAVPMSSSTVEDALSTALKICSASALPLLITPEVAFVLNKDETESETTQDS